MDSGNFDWEAYGDRFPGLTTPDETYHGIVYTQKFGRMAYIMKATAQLMRDLGSIQSPPERVPSEPGGWRPCLSEWSATVRMPGKAAEYLQGHEKVAWVSTPALPGDRYYDLAQKYLPDGTCGVITFGLKRRKGCGSPHDGRLKR